ncbi:GNAT family N-acetyltransferase [uncultured Methylobacterium sp.]|uniref:GNAT family N-acetyltransferase n=1 Tax=uncultured Methylobacterium sp. TaxID=157278 RepID=UPI0035C9E5CF
MTVLAQGPIGRDLTGASMVRARMSGSLTAEVFRDLGAVEALWRGLEAEAGCLATPYQRFDWVSAFHRAHGTADALRILVLRDAGGRPRMLLPLVVARAHGVAVARIVGGDHANYHLPLFASRDAAAVPAEAVIGALVQAGRAAGIDVYALGHQPRTWDGAVNPLALTGEPAASDGYGMMLGPDPEATVRRAFSADARKKLRSKEKRLIEAHGPVAYRQAAGQEEAERFLAAFYAQKAARFSAMGIADPYAGPAIRRFLAAATAGERPAIEIHALVIEASGRVLATFGGAVDAGRYSGMMTAFDADPEIARYSPGDLLLSHLVRAQAARGRRALDLGVGEARYKASICDETIELVEAMLPVTLRGHAYARIAARITRLKRRIKRDPRLFGYVQRLRRLKAA